MAIRETSRRQEWALLESRTYWSGTYKAGATGALAPTFTDGIRMIGMRDQYKPFCS